MPWEAPPCLGQNGASHGEVTTVRWSGDDRGGNEKGGRQLRGLLCNASLGKAGSPNITVGSLASYSTHFKIYPVFVKTVQC